MAAVFERATAIEGVTELLAADEAGDGSANIVFRSEAFAAGYALARHELRASLVLATEQFLRGRGDVAGRSLRPILYAFQEHLEREIDAMQLHGGGYVEDGLGI